MATDLKEYLATEVISEQRTVSYRNVARALKVHVNAAKCMLYEFHEAENKQKPASVNATYLLAGRKKRQQAATSNGKITGHANDSQPIPSSPPPFTSSMLEPSQQERDTERGQHVYAPVHTITLAREKDLQTVKDQYEEITSIHIYSLSPHPIQDLVTLTDIGRGLFEETFIKEDPLLHNKTYGVIQNSLVRRRKGKRPVIAEVSVSKTQVVKEESKKSNAATIPPLKKEDSSRPTSRDSASTANSKQPALKRDGSNLFKSFAKAAQNPKLERKDTNQSSVSGAEDTKMTDADEEGESEDEALFLDTGTRKAGTKKRVSDVTKDREDKRVKLRKMMDSDDDEPALPNVEEASDAKARPDASMQGGDEAEKPEEENAKDENEVAWSDSDTEKQGQNAEERDVPAPQNGEQDVTNPPKKRRGKRKVMKKRTMKDEDGYLVTREEAVWESFSEDEPIPKVEKPKSGFAPLGSGRASSSQKGTGSVKAATAKKGGNIMSFFGKK